MKKLLFILFASFAFIACSSDDDDEPEYLDNNLIAGKWYHIQATDSVIRSFENNVLNTYIYDKYTETLKQTFSKGTYKLTDDMIYFINYPNDAGWKYKLVNNKLSMLETGDIWVDYQKVK